MKLRTKKTTSLSILIGVLLFSGVVYSASVTPIVGYIGSYSSNILRESSDEQWEWVNRPLLGFDVDHRGRSFNAYGYATAEYFDFTQETAENETYFDINAVAEWNIIGDRFTWILEDYASVTPIIVSDPLTPLNVEQRNIFVTGPTVATRLGTRNMFDWGLRYGHFFYELSNIDNQRLLTDFGISRQIRPDRNIRIGYALSRTVFAEEFYQDYIRQDADITYAHIGSGSSIYGTIGYTYIDQEDIEESIDGVLLRLVGSKNISQRTLINVIANSGLTDTGLANLTSGVGEVIPNVTVSPNQAFYAPSQVATTEIFRESVLRFGVLNSNPTLITGLGVGYIQADYVSDDISDNRRIGLDLTIDHPIRMDSLFGVYMSMGRQEFPNEGDNGYIDDDGHLGARITWRLFRRVNFVFDVSRYVRRSNEPDRGYTESVAEVQLIYRPSGRRSEVRSVQGR